MVTKRFMIGVKERHYWCLRSQDIVTFRVCADPPSKLDVAFILSEVMTNYRPMGEPLDTAIKRTALLIRKQPPSVSWQLLVLS